MRALIHKVKLFFQTYRQLFKASFIAGLYAFFTRRRILVCVIGEAPAFENQDGDVLLANISIDVTLTGRDRTLTQNYLELHDANDEETLRLICLDCALKACNRYQFPESATFIKLPDKKMEGYVMERKGTSEWD
jgi:hypothetical protein